MKITFLVVGKTNHSSLIQLQEEYQNRLKHYISFETITIPELKNTKNISENEQKEKEADLILKQLETTDEVILLDEKGKQLTSVAFSEFLSCVLFARISMRHHEELLQLANLRRNLRGEKHPFFGVCVRHIVGCRFFVHYFPPKL